MHTKPKESCDKVIFKPNYELLKNTVVVAINASLSTFIHITNKELSLLYQFMMQFLWKYIYVVIIYIDYGIR